MRLNQCVEREADRRRGPGEVDQSVAGDVDQCVHAGNGAQNF